MSYAIKFPKAERMSVYTACGQYERATYTSKAECKRKIRFLKYFHPNLTFKIVKRGKK